MTQATTKRITHTDTRSSIATSRDGGVITIEDQSGSLSDPIAYLLVHYVTTGEQFANKCKSNKKTGSDLIRAFRLGVMNQKVKEGCLDARDKFLADTFVNAMVALENKGIDNLLVTTELALKPGKNVSLGTPHFYLIADQHAGGRTFSIGFNQFKETGETKASEHVLNEIAKLFGMLITSKSNELHADDILSLYPYLIKDADRKLLNFMIRSLAGIKGLESIKGGIQKLERLRRIFSKAHITANSPDELFVILDKAIIADYVQNPAREQARVRI